MKYTITNKIIKNTLGIIHIIFYYTVLPVYGVCGQTISKH